MIGNNRSKSINVLHESNESMLRSISLDCVIFSFHDGELKLLLNKFTNHDKWMLPGGFVYYDESVDDAAYRVISSRTSLNKVVLRQFYVFGDKDRTNNIPENKQMLLENNVNFYNKEGHEHWLLQRFVTVGYYAFVKYREVKVATNKNEEVAWFNFDEIPQLAYDHNYVIEKARRIIKYQLQYLPIGYELLPDKFTMTELRTIYETIVGKKLDRRNFQKTILSSGFVIKLEEMSKKFGRKATSLFSFNHERYKEIETELF